MNANEVETLQDQEQIAQKRTYRRPVIQFYGTLKDLTQASFQNAPHRQDNPAPIPPAAQRPFYRT